MSVVGHLVIVKTQTTSTVSDKVKNRLEQLDDFEEVNNAMFSAVLILAYLLVLFASVCIQGSVKEMLDLSQQEYVKRIEELNQVIAVDDWKKTTKLGLLSIFF